MRKRFKCNRCGECCRISPKLGREDIRKILKKGIEKDYFIEMIRGKTYMKIKNDKCVFLRKNGKKYACKIYDSRPKICREYPSLIVADCRPERFAFDDYLARRNAKD